MNRALVTIGLVLVVVGLLWSWIPRMPLGRLPGDISFGRGGFRFYFPLATCFLISVVLSLVLWLLRR